MAYPRSFIKYTVGGSVAQEDIWTNGLSLLSANDEQTRDLFVALQPVDFKTLVDTFYATGTQAMNGYNTVEWIKIAHIGTDGKYLSDAKIYDYSTPKPGTGTFAVSPQDSVVISELTEAKRGLARRGRIYLPAGFAIPDSTTGRIPSVQVGNVLAKAKAYFDGISTLMETKADNGRIVVASSVREGQFRNVLSLELGNLVDNQSRRRNRLQEVYTETTLIIPTT